MTATKRQSVTGTKMSAEPEDVKRTSQSLILRVKENDPAAWERLVKLYSPLVYFWCQGSGLSQPDVNDVFQDVFHTLARNIEKFRPIKNGSFRGWLRTLTRNKLNDHFRKNGREPKPIGGTEALNYLEQMPDVSNANSTSGQSATAKEEIQINHSLLRKALENIRDKFTEQTWKAFWMVVIDGREAIDVAGDLSMKPGTVRVAKSRVLKRLRLEIGDSIE
jgi:RNA polymerase sigma-70 factor (ECF subfamily)